MALTLEFRPDNSCARHHDHVIIAQIGVRTYACSRPCVPIRPTDPACWARRPGWHQEARNFQVHPAKGIPSWQLILSLMPSCDRLASAVPPRWRRFLARADRKAQESHPPKCVCGNGSAKFSRPTIPALRISSPNCPSMESAAEFNGGSPAKGLSEGVQCRRIRLLHSSMLPHCRRRVTFTRSSLQRRILQTRSHALDRIFAAESRGSIVRLSLVHLSSGTLLLTKLEAAAVTTSDIPPR
jgi:hypothetical protein